MKIGIFANPIIQEKTGVGRYAYNLVKEILTQDKEHEYILFAHFLKHYKERKTALENFISETGNKKAKTYISRIPNSWRDWLSGTSFPMNWLYREKVDTFFSLFPTGSPKAGFNKKITVIHDLVFAKYPETQGDKFSKYYFERTKNAVGSCQKLICVSQTTEKDLINYFRIKGNKTEVVSPAINNQIFNPKIPENSLEIIKKYKITKPYILAVGTLEPRKNLEGLIDAFLSLPEKLQDKYQIVLVGESGWFNKSLLEKIDQLVNKGDKIVKTGYVIDNDLPFLYSSATVFVYPSLYEGFGIPPLEAMACGCPVITSNVSSLPEVVGDAGILVNPSVREISKNLEKILTNKKLRLNLRNKGLEQTKKFSWKISAQKIIKIFNRI